MARAKRAHEVIGGDGLVRVLAPQCPTFAIVGPNRYLCRSHEGGVHYFAARWPACPAPFCRLEPGHRGLHDVPAGTAEVARTFTVQRRNGQVFTVLVPAADYGRVMAAGAWHLDARGYVVHSARRGPSLKLSRFILGYGPGDPSVDHRNGDKLDNTRTNLRPLTDQENFQNLAAVNNRGVSRYRGVTFHRSSGKWRAQAEANGCRYSLGLHATEEDAAHVLREWRAANLPHDERGVSQ